MHVYILYVLYTIVSMKLGYFPSEIIEWRHSTLVSGADMLQSLRILYFSFPVAYFFGSEEGSPVVLLLSWYRSLVWLTMKNDCFSNPPQPLESRDFLFISQPDKRAKEPEMHRHESIFRKLRKSAVRWEDTSFLNILQFLKNVLFV